LPNIWQVTWAWTGFSGATGYTNLYYLATAGDGAEALAACTKARRLFEGIKGQLPPSVNIGLVTDVRLLKDSDGALQNIFTVTGIGPVTGTAAAGPYSAPSGGCVDWPTGIVHGRHMMTGRTFLVPLAQTAYENNGTIAPAVVITMANSAEDMRTAAGPQFGVWGRPKTHKDPLGNTVVDLAGAWHPAISSRIPDKAVVLRSRRD